MVGSLRESISSYATIYAPAAAQPADHGSIFTGAARRARRHVEPLLYY